MNKKFLCFLCVSFVFMSCAVMANEIRPPFMVKINGILMYDGAAVKIFKDAKNKQISAYDAKHEAIKVDVVTEGTDVIISGSELMDTVAELYNKAILNKDNSRTIVCEIKKSIGKITVVYVNKEEKLVDSIIFKTCKTDDC